jgi:hypothetical protein
MHMIISKNNNIPPIVHYIGKTILTLIHTVPNVPMVPIHSEAWEV